MKKFFVVLIIALVLASCSLRPTAPLATTIAQEESLPDLDDESSYTLVDTNSVFELKKGALIKVNGLVTTSSQNKLLQELIIYDGKGLWKAYVDAISNKEPIPENTSFDFYGFFDGEEDKTPVINVYMYEPVD